MADVHEPSLDAIEAGAPADENEIEVTPEMIEAGAAALWRTRGWARQADEDWPALMTAAYRAMVKARP
jgi:hypothetical protein